MKIVLIGGTMESKIALDYLAKVINRIEPEHEISTYTYAFALHNRSEINRILEGSFLITHSTGAMVLNQGVNPVRAVFVSPSQPVARYKIIYRSFLKTVAHSWRYLFVGNRSRTLRILVSNVVEFLSHPYQNLRPFISGDVSRFDLRDVLPKHKLASENNVKIIISTRDEMFTKSENMFDDIKLHGVEVVEIDAMHDDLFIDSEKIIFEVLKR